MSTLMLRFITINYVRELEKYSSSLLFFMEDINMKVAVNLCFGGFMLPDKICEILKCDTFNVKRDDPKLIELIEKYGSDDNSGESVNNEKEILKNAFESVGKVNINWCCRDIFRSDFGELLPRCNKNGIGYMKVYLEWWYPYLSFNSGLMKEAVKYVNSKISSSRNVNCGLGFGDIDGYCKTATLIVTNPDTSLKSFSELFYHLRTYFENIDPLYKTKEIAYDSLWNIRYGDISIENPYLNEDNKIPKKNHISIYNYPDKKIKSSPKESPIIIHCKGFDRRISNIQTLMGLLRETDDKTNHIFEQLDSLLS